MLGLKMASGSVLSDLIQMYVQDLAVLASEGRTSKAGNCSCLAQLCFGETESATKMKSADLSQMSQAMTSSI